MCIAVAEEAVDTEVEVAHIPGPWAEHTQELWAPQLLAEYIPAQQLLNPRSNYESPIKAPKLQIEIFLT